MATEAQEAMKIRIRELIEQPNSWTDEELAVLTGHLNVLRATEGGTTNSLAQLRTNLELIASLRAYDKSSAKLGTIVFRFTVVATIATIVQALYAVLGYYWPWRP